MIYVAFTHMDSFGGFDSVMSIVCGLSRFGQFVPCKKALIGQLPVNYCGAIGFNILVHPKKFNVTMIQDLQTQVVSGKVV